MSQPMTAASIEKGFRDVQDHICKFFLERTGQKYQEDIWNYDKGEGGGVTRIWEGQDDHDPLEKAGVNFSGIKGPSLPASALTQLKLEAGPFYAAGVSLVIHPRNPHIPTIHMNIRYFESGESWWFGGGIDLTPYYPIADQVIQFHKTLKEVCERNGHDYSAYKKVCDGYFFIQHRGEMRGVSGIFFDHLTTSDKQLKTKEQLWTFVRDLGTTFTSIYGPFIEKSRQALPYTPSQREFQLIRRSRYVEFNLVYDRGTKFGLQSEGRAESILMSLPAVAIWKYNWKPIPKSAEDILITFYLKPQDWVNMKPENVPTVVKPVDDQGKRLVYGLLATGLVAASASIVLSKR